MKSLRSSEVKRSLFTVSLTLAMVTSLGACCEEEPGPTPDKVTAPVVETSPSEADAEPPGAVTQTPETSGESEDNDEPDAPEVAAAQDPAQDTAASKDEAPAQPGEESASGSPEDADAGDAPTDTDAEAVAEGGAPAEDADAEAVAEGGASGENADGGVEPSPEGEAEAGGDDATASTAAQGDEAPVEEKKTDGGKVKDQPPFEPGDLYKGPPSKAIVGRWRITVPEHAIPKGLPKEERERLKAMGDITMQFDGRQALVRYGDQRERFDYKVVSEKDISLQLTTQRDGAEQMIFITFYDMDNILLNEPRYPGPARGARVKP